MHKILARHHLRILVLRLVTQNETSSYTQKLKGKLFSMEILLLVARLRSRVFGATAELLSAKTNLTCASQQPANTYDLAVSCSISTMNMQESLSRSYQPVSTYNNASTWTRLHCASSTKLAWSAPKKLKLNHDNMYCPNLPYIITSFQL